MNDRLTMTSDKGGVAFTFDLDITCEKSEIMKILKVAQKLKEYEEIGTVEECWEAMERQRAKKPKHFYKKYGKHKWRRKENGEIDDFAWEFDYHNGVACEICGETVCVHCNPNYDELDDCEEEHWNCPNCGKIVGWKSKYCDCGQAIDWSDTD